LQTIGFWTSVFGKRRISIFEYTMASKGTLFFGQ
jgi:hypothetical protein